MDAVTTNTAMLTTVLSITIIYTIEAEIHMSICIQGSHLSNIQLVCRTYMTFNHNFLILQNIIYLTTTRLLHNKQ